MIYICFNFEGIKITDCVCKSRKTPYFLECLLRLIKRCIISFKVSIDPIDCTIIYISISVYPIYIFSMVWTFGKNKFYSKTIGKICKTTNLSIPLHRISSSFERRIVTYNFYILIFGNSIIRNNIAVI